jgi:maltose O-acetyltransferase
MSQDPSWRKSLEPFLPDQPRWPDLIRFGLSWTKEDLETSWRHLLTATLAGSVLTPRLVRWRMYRRAGFRIDTPNISDHCVFRLRDLSVGRGSLINAYAFFNGIGSVSIGEATLIGPRSVILTSHHEIHQDGSVSATPIGRPVSIGSRVWVGADCHFVPGSVVEDDCIIGAGSVVTGRCERGGFYAGVPARRLREAKDLYRP